MDLHGDQASWFSYMSLGYAPKCIHDSWDESRGATKDMAAEGGGIEDTPGAARLEDSRHSCCWHGRVED